MPTTIGTAYVQILPSTEGIKGKLQELLGQEGESSGESFAKKFGSKLSSGLGSAASLAAKGIGIAVGAAATGVTALTKSAVDAYGSFEQLTGGVETLFGAGGRSLDEYAQSVGKSVNEVREEYSGLMNAQTEVLGNASEAYLTAGLSANEYMETVTSFSASLIQSLGGDTQKAAEYADKAIIDMSDNANKMGTDMSAIQNAYQGFAKQNYTMLDNLKLGYGGTKTEMERLVEDAEKLDSSFKAQRDTNGDLTLSYADIVDAIHIVQTEMDITGTTQKEALTTIQGSMNATKAAWQNLLIAFGSGEDVKDAIDNLVSTASVAVKNIIPVVKQALTGIAEFVKEIGPIIVEELPGLIQELLPGLLDAAISLVGSLVEALPGILEAVWSVVKELFGTFMDWMREKNPELAGIVEGAVDLIRNTLSAIVQYWDEIKGKFQEGFAELKTDWENIKTAFAELWESAKEIALDVVDGIKSGISDRFNSIKDTISNIIDGIKNLFHFNWSFPDLKLPHLVYELIDIPVLGTIPNPKTFHVEWYQKAYNTPWMFTEPTIAGFGDGSGGEMVYGHESLMRDIEEASGGKTMARMNETLDRLDRILTELLENGIDARAYMDGRLVSDSVSRYQRRAARAGGVA